VIFGDLPGEAPADAGDAWLGLVVVEGGVELPADERGGLVDVRDAADVDAGWLGVDGDAGDDGGEFVDDDPAVDYDVEDVDVLRCAGEAGCVGVAVLAFVEVAGCLGGAGFGVDEGLAPGSAGAGASGFEEVAPVGGDELEVGEDVRGVVAHRVGVSLASCLRWQVAQRRGVGSR
jgi:hypothetical protein